MQEQGASTLLYWLVVACETTFWVLLLASLIARYLLRSKALGIALLYALPVVDLLLLGFTALDLKAGTPVEFAHGLAAAYVGFTVGFGGMAIRWADQHFAYRFAGGPLPAASPSRGWPGVRYEMALWFRCVVAWLITGALLAALIAFVDTPTIAQDFEEWFRIGFFSILLWFVFGPVWRLVFFGRRQRHDV